MRGACRLTETRARTFQNPPRHRLLFGFLGAFLGGAHAVRGALRVVVGGAMALGKWLGGRGGRRGPPAGLAGKGGGAGGAGPPDGAVAVAGCSRPAGCACGGPKEQDRWHCLPKWIPA